MTTTYTAISLSLTGDKIERRSFSCRKQVTAQGCVTDFADTPRIIKLMGRTTHWFVDGQWFAGLAADKALVRAGFVGLR